MTDWNDPASRREHRLRYLDADGGAARERERQAGAARRAKVRAVILRAKSTPCVDCGALLPPECMDLDHVRGEVLFSLSCAMSAKVPPGMTRLQAVEAEVAKCDVRCPNCHRLRHWRERERGVVRPSGRRHDRATRRANERQKARPRKT